MEEPQPSPNPTHPIPGGGNPIEINTGDLHSKPEVDIGTQPSSPPSENPSNPPHPEIVPDPGREEPPSPDTQPQ
ncbi:MAG: hypothetical protein ACLGHN_00960 [Bacteriovoracia bacterium]